MNILAIDTSTASANVSISKDNVVFSKSINNEITHSEKMLPLIDNILQEAEISLNDISKFCCSIGPGSFTGIRIGISTIKAFAKVTNKDIFAVSTLDILAYSVIDKKPKYIISSLDARNSRMYYAVYKVNYLKHYSETIPVLEVISDYKNDDIDEVLKSIDKVLNNENSSSALKIFVCDKLENFEDKITDCFELEFTDLELIKKQISTDTLIEMFKNYSKVGYDTSFIKTYLTLDAMYIRQSQAERYKNGEI